MQFTNQAPRLSKDLMENKFWCNTITNIVEQKLCRFDFIKTFKLITSLGRFIKNLN